MYSDFVDFVRSIYKTEAFIPLHEPRFGGNEKKYLNDCIDSTFVSSVGEYVNRFEQMMAEYTGSKYAIAASNGTSALHIALLLSGVERDDEVITQPLTFIATANAISYTGAKPVFIDVDKEGMGLSPEKLADFLREKCIRKANGFTYNKESGKRIAACVPMHTFGLPLKIDELAEICVQNNIVLIEDAAESLGSYYKKKHTGSFGRFGIFSFNGNKTITTGGGGMITTDDEELAKKAKHITTQAKVPHKWDYVHDMIGYNYRLTNIQSALGVAQMEQLPAFIENKRALADKYLSFFENSEISFCKEPTNTSANYWLNAISLPDREERNRFLTYTNENGIMTRPIWELMNRLPMFSHCQTENIENAEWLADRIVNIPSSVVL